MRLARFFVPGIHRREEVMRIEGSDVHHILDVLRLESGARVEVIDSASHSFIAELVCDGRQVNARLVEELARVPGANLRVDIAQALPKGSKMDYVVEKATELGVAAILPFCSERAIVRGSGPSKVERWRRLARSAAEQCGRRDIPAVLAPMEFEDVLARFCAYDCVLFAWESGEPTPLRERLPSLLADARSVLAVVGPEGGFSHAEADAAKARGVEVISLGERVLRTETAALVLVAIVNYVAEGRNVEAARRIISG
ncbi:MAG TPA: 16S rRNA (uracil(1498)-N(3))-methyltransferase [Candidatus Tyrphobacter sp.]